MIVSFRLILRVREENLCDWSVNERFGEAQEDWRTATAAGPHPSPLPQAGERGQEERCRSAWEGWEGRRSDSLSRLRERGGG